MGLELELELGLRLGLGLGMGLDAAVVDQRREQLRRALHELGPQRVEHDVAQLTHERRGGQERGAGGELWGGR